MEISWTTLLESFSNTPTTDCGMSSLTAYMDIKRFIEDRLPLEHRTHQVCDTYLVLFYVFFSHRKDKLDVIGGESFSHMGNRGVVL